jgi:glycosyltransferase 2 family protein
MPHSPRRRFGHAVNLVRVGYPFNMTDPETNSPGTPPDSPFSAKRWAWRIVKWGLCLLVLGFVGRRAWQLWRQEDWSHIHFELGWLLLAGLAYALGWLPSVWFWRRMIKQVGGVVRFDDAARAYYCGHLGKYVPGKAAVLVIRSALLKDRGSPVSVSVLTATCETLMMMATGAAMAVFFLPWLVRPEQLADWPAWVRWIIATSWLPGLIVMMLCWMLSPIIASFLTLLAVKFTPKGMLGGETRVSITPKLVIQGLAAFAGSWMLHGLSLGLTLRAVSDRVTWTSWPAWTGGVAGATSAGFAALFAPGGLGVREGLLMAVLENQPNVTDGQAVIVPLLLRAVWFLSEICLAAVLYYGIRAQFPDQTNLPISSPDPPR